MKIELKYIEDFMVTKDNGDITVRVTNMEEYSKFYLAMKNVLDFKNVDHILIHHPDHYFNAKIFGSTFLIAKDAVEHSELCNIAKVESREGLYKIYLESTDNMGRFISRNGKSIMYIADRQENILYVIKKLHEHPTFSSATAIQMSKPIFGRETLIQALNMKFTSYVPIATYWNEYKRKYIDDLKNVEIEYVDSSVVTLKTECDSDGNVHILGYLQKNLISGTEALCTVSKQDPETKYPINVTYEDVALDGCVKHEFYFVPVLNLYHALKHASVKFPSLEYPIEKTKFYLPRVKFGFKKLYLSENGGENCNFILHDIKGSTVSTHSLDLNDPVLEKALLLDLEDADWMSKSLYPHRKKNIHVVQQMNNKK